MNLKKLNIGIPLSKEEQKNIRGGAICNAGQSVLCHCSDTTNQLSPIMPESEIAIAWCMETEPCAATGHGHVVSSEGCVG